MSVAQKSTTWPRMTGGALTAAGRLNLPMVIVLATVGAALGDTLTFLFGRLVRARHERRMIDLYCRWTHCTLGSNHCHQQARSYIERFRGRALLFSKFVVGVRQFVSPVAGITGMRLIRFLALDAVGFFGWAAAFTALGFFAADYLQSFASQFHRSAFYMSVAAGIMVAGFFTLKLVKLRSFGAPREETIQIEEAPLERVDPCTAEAQQR